MCTVDSPDTGDEAVVELSSCCGCCLNMEPVFDMSRGASGAAAVVPCPDAGLMECEGITACDSWLFDVEEE